ncbi:uncharacterized protein [Antedon mediterranea]|uniref:uncharacterized protein n=1 Tax=Antedon mediterranea TaxID=105859 RepID=UPI003AF9D898
MTDNGVDMAALQLLSESDIVSLIPKIGIRAKFSERLRKHEIINIDQYLENVSHHTHPQPYILALGADKLTSTEHFVVNEKQIIKQPSLLKAVDVCYKAHFVLDCKYQAKCKWVWKFFESCIYKQSKDKVESSSLRAFRAYLKFKQVL